jgi:hypothetical protein
VHLAHEVGESLPWIHSRVGAHSVPGEGSCGTCQLYTQSPPDLGYPVTQSRAPRGGLWVKRSSVVAHKPG